MPETLLNWLFVVNAAVIARGLWIVTNSFKHEAIARQLQAEADMLNARIADEKWERFKAEQAQKEAMTCDSAEQS